MVNLLRPKCEFYETDAIQTVAVCIDKSEAVHTTGHAWGLSNLCRDNTVTALRQRHDGVTTP